MYIGDDVRLAEAFKIHKQISILAVDQFHLPQLMDMLTLAGMPKISTAARYELLAADASAIDTDATRRIRQRIPHLMRLLYARAHASFDRMATQGLWAASKTIEVRTVPVLEVQANIGDHRINLAVDTYREGSTIYMQAGTKAKFDKIAQELCVFFGARPEMLSDSVYRVLTAPSDEELQEFFDVKGVSGIPEDELARLTESEAQTTQPPDFVDGEDADAVGSASEAERTENAATVDARVGNVGQSAAGSGFDSEKRSPSYTASNTQHSGSVQSSNQSGSSGRDPADSGMRPTPEAATSVGSATRSEPAAQRDRDRKRSARAVTYAEPKSPSEQRLDDETNEQRLAVAKAAVAFVLETERRDGHDVVEMPFLNEGFDVRRKRREIEEFIEVKGLTGGWDVAGVVVTPPELRTAEQARGQYWLYVVEYALDPERRQLYKIPDPYGKVDQFRFDAGWKAFAANRANALEPGEGRRISIDGVGSGIILSVAQSGMFRRINVRLDSGEELSNRIFDPAKMTVAEAP
jgi:hypothetical protein